MKQIVEVKIKPKFLDAPGAEFKHAAASLGVKITDAKLGRLFLLEGFLTKQQIKKIAHKLLTDVVTENCKLDYSFGKTNGLHKIELWLKDGVTDVVGESVKDAVLDMGIKGITNARCGFVYYIKGKLTKKQVQLLAEKILVNPLVHRYKIT
jgi:phosphoribosylformylglycinamidine (FGAM) synthase PurS component